MSEQLKMQTIALEYDQRQVVCLACGQELRSKGNGTYEHNRDVYPTRKRRHRVRAALVPPDQGLQMVLALRACPGSAGDGVDVEGLGVELGR